MPYLHASKSYSLFFVLRFVSLSFIQFNVYLLYVNAWFCVGAKNAAIYMQLLTLTISSKIELLRTIYEKISKLVYSYVLLLYDVVQVPPYIVLQAMLLEHTKGDVEVRFLYDVLAEASIIFPKVFPVM